MWQAGRVHRTKISPLNLIYSARSKASVHCDVTRITSVAIAATRVGRIPVGTMLIDISKTQTGPFLCSVEHQLVVQSRPIRLRMDSHLQG